MWNQNEAGWVPLRSFVWWRRCGQSLALLCQLVLFLLSSYNSTTEIQTA